MIVHGSGIYKVIDFMPLTVKMSFITDTVNPITDRIIPRLIRHVNISCQNSIGRHVGTALIH